MTIPKEAIKDHKFIFSHSEEWTLNRKVDIYKCSKCGIWCGCSVYLVKGSIYLGKDWRYLENRNRSSCFFSFLKELTCDEYIIKDIIE